MANTVFNYTGADQIFTVPSGVYQLFIQAWGAAGGSEPGFFNSGGGPGGYSQGYLPVVPGQQLTIIVGQGGTNYTLSGSAAQNPTYGGGGGGGNSVIDQTFFGCSGGGRSAVRLADGTEILTAGGGGGAGSSTAEGTSIGGGGGGTSGQAAYDDMPCYAPKLGLGGTQAAGGTGGTGYDTVNNGGDGSQFTGGTGGDGSTLTDDAGGAGGGGGGYYGGGGGAGEAAGGAGCPPSPGSQDVAGGGGSGYIGGVFGGLTQASPITSTTPPNTGDPNYVAGIGESSTTDSVVGGNGLVVFSYAVDSLMLTKTVSETYANIGDILTYTIAVNNPPTSTALSNVVFMDTIPSGTSFVPGSMSINGTATTANPASPVSLGAMNANTTSTVSFQVKVGSGIPSPNPAVNTALANYTGNDTDPFYSNGAATTISAALLAANKTVNPQYADLGTTLTYSIALPNTGNTTANNILFIDTIPSGVTFVNGSLQQDGTAIAGTPNPPGISLPNPVGPGTVSTVTYQVVVNTVPSGQQIANSATVSYAYTANPSVPNGATGSADSGIVSATVSHANISSMVKTASSTAAAIGDILTYTLVLSNTGNTTATNVVIIDTIPASTSFVAGSLRQDGTPVPGNPTPPGIGLPGPIPAGGVSTVSFQVTVTSLPSMFSATIVNAATALFSYAASATITATGSSNSNVEDTNVSNYAIVNTAAATYSYAVSPTITATGSVNSNNASTSVYSPIISAVKSVSASTASVGQVLTYTVVLGNNGNTTASNYLFTDTIPGGTVFLPGSLMVNGASKPGSPAPPTGVTLPDLGVGQTTTVTFQVTAVSVPTPSTTPNSAVSNYTFIYDPSQGTIRNGATITNTVYTNIQGVPVVSLVKSVDQIATFVGNTLHYTITFQNTGSSTANGVFFTDTTPNGTVFVPNSVMINGVPQTGATLNPPSGVTLPAIGAGQTATLTYQVTVNTIPNPNPTVNQGTASYSTGAGTSIVNTNTVASYVHHNTTPVKQVSTQNAHVGDTITYTLTWTEMDGMTAQNVTFVDTIPNETNFVANSVTINGVPQPGMSVLPPAGLNVGSVGANQTVTVTFQVKVVSV